MEKGSKVFQEGTLCLKVGAREHSLRSWRRSEERRGAGYVLVGEIKPITWKTRDVGCETKEAARFK